MDFFNCVLGRRSCRRFESDAIPRADLDKMIDAGRYAPSGYNCQPVRFAIIQSPEKVAATFECTGWLTGRPEEGERPVAYIAVACDDEVAPGEVHPSCSAYAVMLAAHALGYGSCWHGCSTNAKLKALLDLGETITPHVLVSLGKPAEQVVVADPSTDWRVNKDDDGVIHLGKLGRDQVTLAVL